MHEYSQDRERMSRIVESKGKVRREKEKKGRIVVLERNFQSRQGIFEHVPIYMYRIEVFAFFVLFMVVVGVNFKKVTNVCRNMYVRFLSLLENFHRVQ